MKEAIEEITVAVNALMVMSAKFDRGQVIPYELIEEITGPHGEGRGVYLLRKWRKALEREREIVTLPLDTVGIRLLTHKETAVEIPQLRQGKAYRQIRRAIKQTSLVDATRLTVGERKLLSAQRTYMADQRRSLYRSQRELDKGVTITEGNPRRKVPVA